jgi:hypothetical protein
VVDALLTPHGACRLGRGRRGKITVQARQLGPPGSGWSTARFSIPVAGSTLAAVPMPRPGDRSPGFFVEPSRCWAFVYDHNLQGTYCREAPSFKGRRHSPARNGKWWRLWSCPDHIDCLTAVRELGRSRR